MTVERRHMAIVEFRDCKETVDSMLARGFSKKLIHERLVEEGRMSMHYITFCEYIRNAKANPVSPPPPPVDNRPARPARIPGIIKSNMEPLPDPRNIDPKTLI
jgi:hypothetical protein